MKKKMLISLSIVFIFGIIMFFISQNRVEKKENPIDENYKKTVALQANSLIKVINDHIELMVLNSKTIDETITDLNNVGGEKIEFKGEAPLCLKLKIVDNKINNGTIIYKNYTVTIISGRAIDSSVRSTIGTDACK